MNIGTAGVPIALAQTRDYDQIFLELAQSGIDVFFPTTLYEEIPVRKGLGFEADLLPPPYGYATPEIYQAARDHGIKICFPADILFPIIDGAIQIDPSPLQAIVDMGAADIIHSIAGFDEAAWNDIDPALSQMVYEHVKAVDPSLEVIQIHAPVTTDDPGDYLDQVLLHAQWADTIGFSIYPIQGSGLGARTPQTPDALVPPGEAVQDYIDWIETTLPGKGTAVVLQGFQRLDMFSPEEIVKMTPEELSLSRMPTELELREMMIGAQTADMVFWFGPSMQFSVEDTIWQSVVNVSVMAAEDRLGTQMTDLQDLDLDRNQIDEDAAADTLAGIRLEAFDPDALDTVTYELDDARFYVGAGGVIHVADGARFDFESEASITFTATASSTDGSVSTLDVLIEIRDVIDHFIGTEAGDALLGDVGEDFIEGKEGGDLINGQTGDDIIQGGGGDDFIYGGDGHDTVIGGDGADVIAGDAGNDSLYGGTGADFILADAGNDNVDGGLGNDLLMATLGDNTLIGGLGDDQMQGGTGADSFVFSPNDGQDFIFDFDLAKDKLIFEGLSGQEDLNLQTYGVTAAQITYDGGEIYLFGLTHDDLSGSNFVFE